jgi:kinesin family member 2/24
VFEEHAVNRDVYAATLEPLIKQIKSGFNVTCFAYGMTGAGKTHTMFGQRGEPGIANLVIQDLFNAD